MKKRIAIYVLLAAVLALMLPQDADARAGGGRSMGSRGGNTFSPMPQSSPYRAAPIERTITPQPRYAPPPNMAQPAPNRAPQPSFFSNHPILTTIGGTLLGYSLLHSLFGGSAYGMPGMGYGGMGYGGGGGGGGMGLLLPLLLIGGAYFLYRRWSRQNGGGMANLFPSMSVGGAQASGGNYDSQDDSAGLGNAESQLSVTDSDYRDFTALHEKIQLSWGRGDTDALRGCLTPEMQHYFSQELASDVSRGVANKVEQVKLLTGDLIKAWSEDMMDYATVHMRWSAIDCHVRLDRHPGDADYVVDGSLSVPVEAQEIWTFARARNGGKWVLSAIQQMAT